MFVKVPEGAAMRGAGRAFHRDVTWVMENLSDRDADRIFRQSNCLRRTSYGEDKWREHRA